MINDYAKRQLHNHASDADWLVIGTSIAVTPDSRQEARQLLFTSVPPLSRQAVSQDEIAGPWSDPALPLNKLVYILVY